MDRTELVDVALGHAPADVIVAGGRLVNVGSGEIYAADVAIKGDRVAAFGDVDYTAGPDTRTIDAGGRYLCPGLVEAHLHSYHSYLGVPEFAEGLLRHGVTAYADAFYGQGIVGGAEAVRFYKDAMSSMPVRLLFLVPALAYLQNRDMGLTPAPGITADEMLDMLDWPGCYGVEEPTAPPIIGKSPEWVELCRRTLEKRLVMTGHAAGLDQRTLQAYAAMGVTTDHEAVTVDEAVDRARNGFSLFMRMASSAFHQLELQRALTERGIDPQQFGFCADEASPVKLTEIGTIAHNLRTAIAGGVPPVRAIQMATLHNARAFFAQHDIGQIAPGRYADILLVDDLEAFSIHQVIVGGKTYVEDGRLVEELPAVEYPAYLYDTVKLPAPVTAADFATRADPAAESVEARVIGITDGEFATVEQRARLAVVDGAVQPDVEADVLPIAMVDRFLKGGAGVGTGFAHGFQLERGAMASTVNAVSQNIVVVGTNFEDMAFASNRLAEIGGGFIVVEDGEVKALVELPLQGLMNDEPLDVVMPKFDRAYAAVRELGSPLSSPFVSLEFTFACPGIPDLKLSDEGLMRVSPPERLEVVIG